MEKQKVNGGWCKASVVIGVIAMVLTLLPLASAWFMILTSVNYVLVPIGVICGIVAIVKSQNLIVAIVGLVLCILALFMPYFLSDYYLASAAESVGNMVDSIDKLGDTMDKFNINDYE